MTYLPSTEITAEQELGSGSFEQRRAEWQLAVKRNTELSSRQKKQILRELDFLFTCQRLTRLRRVARQWQEEQLEHKVRLLERREEVINRVLLRAAETNQQIARLQTEILERKLQVTEKVIQLKRRCTGRNPAKEQRKALADLRASELLALKREDALTARLQRRALARARFRQMVEKEFPDLAEELLDYYDQQLYQQGVAG